jgi:hypothetical protein
MARLRLHYAMRISGILLTSSGDRSAAVAALIRERDAALDRLRQEMGESRRQALRAARRQSSRLRSVEVEPSGYPARPGGMASPARGRTRKDYSP